MTDKNTSSMNTYKFGLLMKALNHCRDQCLKYDSILNKWEWPDTCQPSSNLINAHNPSCLESTSSLPKPTTVLFPITTSSLFSLAYLSLTFNLKVPFSRHDNPPSSTHNHTNKHCLTQPTDLWLNSISTSNP